MRMCGQRGSNLAGFTFIHAQRFFDEHVLAVANGFENLLCMRVVVRRNGHNIDIRIDQDLVSRIDERRSWIALTDALQHVAGNIAKRNDIAGARFEVPDGVLLADAKSDHRCAKMSAGSSAAAISPSVRLRSARMSCKSYSHCGRSMARIIALRRLRSSCVSTANLASPQS